MDALAEGVSGAAVRSLVPQGRDRKLQTIVHVLLAHLKFCSRRRNLAMGKEIHEKIMESGADSRTYIATALVNMYCRCGSMVHARQVFDSIRLPDVVSWNTLILGYADNGEGLTALDMFSRMRSRGFPPDSITYVAALKACASLAREKDGSGRTDALEQARQIQSEVGCHSNVYVQSTLINTYAKLGSMAEARHVFEKTKHPSVVSWNSLILGYAEDGEGLNALQLFSRMKSQGCAPDSITYLAALKACASVALKFKGDGRKPECFQWVKQIHLEIGCRLDLHIQNTLVDTYAKCGSMLDAHQVFDCIKRPNVVSWTALLLGYVDSGQGLIALNLLSKMKSEGCPPDSITFAASLKACSLLGALELGRKIHADITEFDEMVLTCLVDFYTKCGSLREAQEVFGLHSKRRGLATWNALLAGYCNFGDAESVLGLFKSMLDEGFQPNGITFQSVLMCCSHGGVQKARECFEAMSARHGVTPSIEHYTCMLDVFGHANKLDDCIILLHRMPCTPNSVTWMTVLGACRKWRNVEIGRLAFQALVTLDQTNPAAYVLMADIYASRATHGVGKTDNSGHSRL